MRKHFYFSEKRNLEFRVDINNLTNTPSFEFPVSGTSGIGIQSPGFTGSASVNSIFARIRDSVNSNSRHIQLGSSSTSEAVRNPLHANARWFVELAGIFLIKGRMVQNGLANDTNLLCHSCPADQLDKDVG